MVGDIKPAVTVNIDSPVRLKAELKTEIPSESSGRLLDALTDIIRPFTERRGLRADQIRLQREDVLIEISRRARERLAIEQGEARPVSPKFLCHFLEKASLEDPESELMDKWADLLANASLNNDENYIWCVNLLAELDGREAGLLDEMYCSRGQFSAVEFGELTRPQAQQEFECVFTKSEAGGFPEMGQLVERLQRFADLSIVYHEDDIAATGCMEFDMHTDEAVLSRLEALGLTWVFADSVLVAAEDRPKRVFVIASVLTPRGIAFLNACTRGKD